MPRGLVTLAVESHPPRHAFGISLPKLSPLAEAHGEVRGGDVDHVTRVTFCRWQVGFLM